MDWLNFHHLHYFWTVYQEGSVTLACERLGVAQPTVSAQIRRLEESLGHKLFRKAGRRLEPTEFGHMVARYAEDIFDVGRELMTAIEREPGDRPLRFTVGVANVLPKLLTHALLEPAFALESPRVRITVHEGKSERLLASLAVKEVDLVLTDAPIPATVKIKAFNHLLGESPIGLFAVPELAARYRPNFPASLVNAPLLLPAVNTSLRSNLDQWFKNQKMSPFVKADFDDSALLKIFGEKGHGLFPAPLTIRSAVEEIFGVELVGPLEGVTERVYAITLERRLTHPAVIRIRETSQSQLFG